MPQLCFTVENTEVKMDKDRLYGGAEQVSDNKDSEKQLFSVLLLVRLCNLSFLMLRPVSNEIGCSRPLLAWAKF